MIRKQAVSYLFALGLAVCCCTSTLAAQITLQNSGFEAPALPSWTYIGGNVQGWNNPQSVGFYLTSDGDSPEGAQSLYGLASRCWLTQTVESATLTNTTYTLECWMKGYATDGFVLGLSGGNGDVNNGGFEFYQNYTTPDGNWHKYTLEYTTGANVIANNPVRISCCYDSGPHEDNVACSLDGFSLNTTSAVPEPSSILALSMAIPGMLLLRRRRSN